MTDDTQERVEEVKKLAHDVTEFMLSRTDQYWMGAGALSLSMAAMVLGASAGNADMIEEHLENAMRLMQNAVRAMVLHEHSPKGEAN